MGYSSWDDDLHSVRETERAKSGTPVFAYTAAVNAGTVDKKTHDKLDPKLMKGGMRESRDSADHPNSVAIGVMFDVTGSMHHVPTVLQGKLAQLMGLLIRKGYVTDPQVMFGAVGDYHSDRAPLQLGQFESGLEMDEHLTNLLLEGGGGGSYEESYQLALYAFARHTVTDCWEKRKHKGYLFLIGDEKPYPMTTPAEIEEVFGDKIQGPLSVEEIIKEAQERYHVFFVIPAGTSHFSDPNLRKRWEGLLNPQHVLMLEDPDAVCETIGAAIGLMEGSTTGDDVAADLKDIGVSDAIAKHVTTTLDPLAKSVALMKVASDLPARTGGDMSIQRL